MEVKVLLSSRHALHSEPLPFRPTDRTVTVAAGDFMFPSVRNAGQDPSVYPNPTEVDITRDLSVFQGFGLGMHSCLGARIIDQSLVAMIKTVS